MITESAGDLLRTPVDVICHQTNFHGVMGGGIAAAIRDKLLTDEEYLTYFDLCRENGASLLGSVQFLKTTHSNVIVANCFCQNAFTSMKEPLTNYDAMRLCLARVEREARRYGYSVGIPGFMGCGIAGGDWETVRGIIKDVFDQSPVDCRIIYLGYFATCFS